MEIKRLKVAVMISLDCQLILTQSPLGDKLLVMSEDVCRKV